MNEQKLKILIVFAKFFLNQWIIPSIVKRWVFEKIMLLFVPKIAEQSEVETQLIGTKTIEVKDMNTPCKHTILYIHGGAFHWGSARSYRHLAYMLAKGSDAVVHIPFYSQSPENQFPTAVNELTDIYQELLEKKNTYEHIIIAGDSAGGNLAFSVTMNIIKKALPKPAAVVAISPWCDLNCTSATYQTNQYKEKLLNLKSMRAWAESYAGKEDLSNPLISPLYGDFSQFPPTMIHCGSNEILLDDSKKLVLVARKQGRNFKLKIWPDMFHVFQLFPHILPEAKRSLEELSTFIKDSTGKVLL